jgi:hypothetical protein
MDIVVIGIVFVFAAYILWLKSKEKRKRIEMEAELYAKFLEKGVEIPANLLETKTKKNNHDSLKAGIFLIFFSLGISLFMFFLSEKVHLAIAVSSVPLFVGLALSFIHYLWKKKGYREDE